MPRITLVVVAAAAATLTAMVVPAPVAARAAERLVQGRSIYFIGDSWSSGLHADPQHTLDQDAAADLGMSSTVDGESGTGYVAAPAGTETYAQRAAEIPSDTRSSIVVIQGGSNDHAAASATLATAADQAIIAVRAAIPGTEVVLLGPGPDPWPITAAQADVDAVLRAASQRDHVLYISPMVEDWFTSSNVDSIIDPANAHPTVQGDKTLGRLLADDLRPHLPGHRPRDGRRHLLDAVTAAAVTERSRLRFPAANGERPASRQQSESAA